MKKLYLLAAAFICLAPLLHAQVSTETFEDETDVSLNFTDNGQVFRVGAVSRNGFDIYSSTSSFGWSGTAADKRFIDNTGKPGIGPGLAVYTSGNAGFVLKSMYLFPARADASFTSLTGVCTISGYRNGALVYTASISAANVNKSFGTNNGYTLADMSTLGGTNNSNTVIDSFTVTCTGNMEYLGLDALRWAPAATPGSPVTETFETVTPNATTFTSSGQQFLIADVSRSQFDIFSQANKGWNGTGVDNKFIDNTIYTYTNPGFTISTDNGAAFTLKSMYLYLSKSTGDLSGITGSCTVTGYKNGSAVFSFTIPTASINQNTAVRNGYTLVDLSTQGGTNNSNTPIDMFSITATNNIEYIGLDAMTWAPSSTLPLRLLDFEARKQATSVDIQWKTDMEEPNTTFTVEKSTDARNFTAMKDIEGKTAAGTLINQYTVTDHAPFKGRNYYRLRMDEGGKITYSKVVSVLFGTGDQIGVNVFPNPVSNVLQVVCDNERLWNKPATLFDAQGRIVRTFTLKSRNEIDVRALTTGTYLLRMPDNTVVKVRKL